MKSLSRPGFLAGLFSCCFAPARAAETLALDQGWRFIATEAYGAAASTWDDSSWQRVDLPHDWSIEGKTDPAAPAEGGGGFFPTGIGWYRKTFSAPEAWRGRSVRIEFDGIYRESEVWLNGQSLGRRPSGFAQFSYNLTPYLRPGADNVIAVRVDNSGQPNSRWYAGSGIYRHVRLVVADPVHFEPDGAFVGTTQLAVESADLKITIEVRNDSSASRAIVVETELIDSQSRSVANARTTGEVAANALLPVALTGRVAQPRLWSPDSPSLYRAVFRVLVEGKETDRHEVSFGIRTIRVSAAQGFELNGRSLKLVGGNVHDDNGPLGTAAFDRAEERRAEQLKAAGFNAVRTAHNPPAAAFLAACDRLGLLVIEDAFDGWKRKKLSHDYSLSFDEWSLRDFDAMVRRDRNHPSVVLWSVGNEPYERGAASGAEIARTLASRARELDSTRPVTAAINGMGKTGDWHATDPVFAALDVAGYNYEAIRYADDHTRLPNRVIVFTESYISETFANWSIAHDQPYVIGDFVWSAIDYLGESGIGRVFPSSEPLRQHWEGSHFPWHGAACGEIDFTGWRKPASHYRAIVWDRGEKLFAAVRLPTPDAAPWRPTNWAPEPLLDSWTWPGHEGRTLQVEVFSRYDAVRLYLNDKALGEQPTTRAQEFKTTFAVPYAPGTLRAAGLQAGREMESFTLTTADPPASIRLTADRSTLRADGQDLAFVNVEITDAKGRLVPLADNAVSYTLTGPGTIAAIGSADLTSTETYRANPRRAFQGRALVVVRTQAIAGGFALTATAPGLGTATITLKSTPQGP